jgi:uncharacterized C2H2 Zn-finger protein
MSDCESYTKKDWENVEKPSTTELVIIPKKHFLDWYEYTKKQVEDIEMKRRKYGLDFMECPNCGSVMEDYTLKGELWHFCLKCDLTFSQKQRDYFTSRIMRVASSK